MRSPRVILGSLLTVTRGDSDGCAGVQLPDLQVSESVYDLRVPGELLRFEAAAIERSLSYRSSSRKQDEIYLAALTWIFEPTCDSRRPTCPNIARESAPLRR